MEFLFVCFFGLEENEEKKYGLRSIAESNIKHQT